MRALAFQILLFTWFTSTYAQYSAPGNLLSNIQELQSHGNDFYNDGLFPSNRFGVREKGKKEDNNIFFTALIAYTLQSLRPSFSANDKEMIDSIIFRAQENYPRYKSRNGDITYNFWQTHPDQPFPNSMYSKRERFRLPDDLDVSAVIYLTKKGSWMKDSLLKNKMIAYTNLYNKKIHSTYKRYRNFKAYNTWFGKDMDLEFDICVMSNVLLFADQKGLAINQYDRETVDVINQIVKNGDHIKHPYIISPSYQSSAVILYHLTRLLSVAPSSQFEDVRAIIVADLKKLLQASKNRMEQVILLSSLYRLKEPIKFDLDFRSIEKDMETFVFFRANLLTTSRLWVRKVFGRMGVFNFNYRCEGYYWALVLEYNALKKQM